MCWICVIYVCVTPHHPSPPPHTLTTLLLPHPNTNTHLKARLLKNHQQALPRLEAIADPLSQQAQGPGMGRAAFQQLRRTGEVRAIACGVYG